jgi:hypothetical protein
MVKPDNSCATKSGHFYLLLTGVKKNMLHVNYSYLFS